MSRIYTSYDGRQTSNENADPDVVDDMLAALDHMIPERAYKHGEGNSRAHVKASMIGSSVSVYSVSQLIYVLILGFNWTSSPIQQISKVTIAESSNGTEALRSLIAVYRR